MLQTDDFSCVYTLERVARIHDQAGALHQPRIVEGGVIGDDHHAIGVGRGGFGQGLQVHPLQVKPWDVRVAVGTVSYTHLTLPTNREVKISVIAVSSKKKTKKE